MRLTILHRLWLWAHDFCPKHLLRREWHGRRDLGEVRFGVDRAGQMGYKDLPDPPRVCCIECFREKVLLNPGAGASPKSKVDHKREVEDAFVAYLRKRNERCAG